MAAGSSWTTPAVNFACCTCRQGRAPHNEERPGIPNDFASRLQVDLRGANTNGFLKNKAREFQMDFAWKKALRLKATVSKKNERKYSREIHKKFTKKFTKEFTAQCHDKSIQSLTEKIAQQEINSTPRNIHLRSAGSCPR